MPRHNNKGRSKGIGQFIPISHSMARSMARSPAWRSLSGPAVKVFVELHSRYNGSNNGDLSLSFGDASRLLGLGKTTIKRAFDELSEKGFIRRMRKGHWYGRRAATWAVTDKTIDIPKHEMATNDWKNWPSERIANAAETPCKCTLGNSFLGTEAERNVA